MTKFHRRRSWLTRLPDKWTFRRTATKAPVQAPPQVVGMDKGWPTRGEHIEIPDNGVCDEACSNTSRIDGGPIRSLTGKSYSAHWLTFATSKMSKLGVTEKKEHLFIDRRMDCLSRISLKENRLRFRTPRLKR